MLTTICNLSYYNLYHTIFVLCENKPSINQSITLYQSALDVNKSVFCKLFKKKLVKTLHVKIIKTCENAACQSIRFNQIKTRRVTSSHFFTD